MWYCHECHAEMRPIMAPGPICASCRGSFVEKMENPEDDPRTFQQAGGFEDVAGNVDVEAFLRGLQGVLAPQSGNRTARSPRPESPRSPRFPEGNSSSSGFRFEFRTGGGSGNGGRSFVIGGPNTHGGRSNEWTNDREDPTMSEFLRQGSPDAGHDRPNITGPMMAQYLMTLLGGPTGRAGGTENPLFDLLNGGDGGDARGGRWGDYVFNQEALDQVISQLMENSNAGRPVPATDEVIENLPREVLEEGSPYLEKDCAVCKEQFKLETEDPDEQVVITLPCKHPFHEPCILPWLKSSGTCPVCRYALVPQPQVHGPGPTPGSGRPGGGQSPTGNSPGSNNRNSGSPGAGSSGGGIFQTLFGGAASGHDSLNRNTFTSRSQPSAPRSGQGGADAAHNAPLFPGGWNDQVD